jgi:elongation factor P
MLATDLKTGVVFKEETFPYIVLRYEHIKSARGGAVVKVKARNLLTGQVLEKSYLGSAKVEDADVRRKNAQYLYKENTSYVFMDPDTYEQIYISQDILGDGAQFLIEGENVQVMYFEDRPVSVDLPISMIFEVTYTEPGYKGNTVSNVYKDATLHNGAQIKVPTFIKIGDKIKVDTRSGEYISKA